MEREKLLLRRIKKSWSQQREREEVCKAIISCPKSFVRTNHGILFAPIQRIEHLNECLIISINLQLDSIVAACSRNQLITNKYHRILFVLAEHPLKMDSNICEYIQQMIDIRLLIRHILDLVNSQTDCAGDDCVTNQDGLNEELRQITEPSTNLSIGYMLLAFLLMIMIMPLQQPLRRQRPTANPRNSNVEHQNHKPSSSHE